MPEQYVSSVDSIVLTQHSAYLQGVCTDFICRLIMMLKTLQFVFKTD